MSQADVPSTVEKLKAKLAHWKEDQDKKTQEVSSCHNKQYTGPCLVIISLEHRQSEEGDRTPGKRTRQPTSEGNEDKRRPLQRCR